MDLEKNQNEEDWQPKLERFKDFRRTGRSSLLPLVFNCFFTFGYCPYYFIHHAQLNNVVYVLELLFLVLSLVCCWVVWSLFDATDEVILRWRHRFKSTFTILVTLCFSFHFIVEFGSFGPEKVAEKGEFEFPTSLILLVIVPFKAAEVFRETNDVVLAIQLSIIIFTLFLMMILSFTSDTLIIFVAYTVMIVLVRVDRAIFSWTVFDDLVEGKRKEEVKERANLELQKKFAEHTRNALEKKIIEMREMIGNVAHDLKTPLTSFATATEMIESDLQVFITTVNEMTTEYEKLLLQLDQTHESSRTKFKLRINNLHSKMLNSMNSVRDIHAFMLMMINRSLDFTKASAGIALIPLVESVNLSAVISKPLNCVRNIQQRVTIQVNSSLNLHTTVRTDRVWLEENLLCTLSNAIKYSTSNTVELSLSIVTVDTLRKTAGRTEDEVMTEKGRPSSARANFVAPEQNDKRIERNNKPIEVYNVNPNSTEEEKKSAHRVSSDVWFATKTVRRASRGYALVYPRVGSSEFTTCNSSTSSIDCKGRIPSKSSLNGLSEEDTRQFVLFEVKDTGKKLSIQEIESFFNPFEQQRLSGGTGLGLYSLAKRVESLGGQYGVHEREDGVTGNVVWFTMPYDVDDEPRSDEMKKEEIHIDNVLPFQREIGTLRTVNLLKEEAQKRILIVEDALAISKMTSSMLKRQTFETDIAENGQIALDKVIRNYERWKSGLERRCDAILMDFQMPVMDGLEATMRIREYEKLHGIEDGCIIIGISAMSDSERIQEALEIGMNAFIPKPFTCKDFHSYLQDFQRRS